MEVHVNRVHLNEKKYTCEECNYATAVPSDLRKHKIRTHTKEFRHRCDYCSLGATGPAELRRHMKARHKEGYQKMLEAELKDKPVPCHFCKKRFPDENQVT